MANKTKEIQRLMPQKPQQQPRPLTDEEKAQQVARFLAQKREAFFQLILGNAIQAANIVPVRQGFKGEDFTDVVEYDLRPLIDASIVAADYAIEKLYPLPKEGEAE